MNLFKLQQLHLQYPSKSGRSVMMHGDLLNANPHGPNSTAQVVKTRTPVPQHGLKTSSASHEAIENTSKTVSKLLRKRALADTLMEIQWYIIFVLFCISSYFIW
jgi:hypothetical protein